jgi:hypothetical protein
MTLKPLAPSCEAVILLPNFANCRRHGIEMITKAMIEAFFEETREFTREGQAKFDIDEPCRWSYYFGDSSEEKLTRLGSYLESEGYEPIGFLEADEEDEDPDTIYLRVDMQELHSVESLHQRNQEFLALVAEYGLASYEGMDVGPLDSEL